MTIRNVSIPARLVLNGVDFPRWFQLMGKEHEDAILETTPYQFTAKEMIVTIRLDALERVWDFDKFFWPDWLELAVKVGAVSSDTLNKLNGHHLIALKQHNDGWTVEKGSKPERSKEWGSEFFPEMNSGSCTPKMRWQRSA